MAKASWITLSVTSGTGNKEVSVTATANPGEPRETVLTIVAGNITKTVACTQDDPNKLNISVATDPTTIGAKCSIGSSATAGVSSGSFYPNTKVTVTASSAPTGYDFLGWYSGSSKLSTSLSYTHTLSATVSLVAKYALKTYTISVSSENTNYGTVSASTTSPKHGTSVTLTATRKTGYILDGWYEGTSKVSSDTTYKFTATSNRTFVAKWKIYNVSSTINISPSDGGTVSPNPMIGKEGTNVTLTATPAIGYQFKHWTYNSNGISTNNPDGFTALNNRTDITAVFELKTYTMSYSTNYGTVSKSTSSVKHGSSDSVTVTAPSNSAQYSYTFLGWYDASTGGNRVSTAKTLELTNITASKSYYARFERTTNSYTHTFNPNGGNTPSPATITKAYNEQLGTLPTCSRASTAQYSYTFVGWFDTDATSGGTQATTTTVVSGTKTWYARWKATTRSYTVTLNAGGGTFATTSGWSLSSSNTVATKTVVYGSSVGTLPTISRASTAQYSYSFKAYSPAISANTTVTGNINATAEWTASTRSYTVTLNAGGGVFSATSGWTLSSSNTIATKTVAYGSAVGTLPTISRSSTAQYSYTFKVYSPTVTTTTTVTGVLTATAQWTSATRSYTLTVTAGTGGTVTGGGTYAYGSKVTLTAKASTNYRFVKWNDGNTSATREVTVTGNATYTATFEFVPYLNLDVTELTFEVTGGTKYINISSNVSWTIS